MREQRLKNHQKQTIFAVAQIYSRLLHPLSANLAEILSGNWIGYGYVIIEFCWGVVRYAEAAVEKPAKIWSPGQELGLPVGVS